MDVILLEKIGRLGGLGDRVKVKDGYARNFLIPQGKALRASKANIEKFEARRAELVKKSDEAKKAAEETSARIAGKTFVVIRQAGDAGHLYGSVSTRDLSAILKAAGADVDYTKITIDTPVKELGIYPIKIAPHPEVIETIKINVARSEEEARVAEEKAVEEARKAAEKKARKEAEAIEAVEAVTEEEASAVDAEAANGTEEASVEEAEAKAEAEAAAEKPAKKRAAKKKAE
ncbi:MAG: 50S ribosomal protein L9 [Rickettsiales bacterium]|jgi:large subunit ribosomal protein L9|nr:50S ribosomal protein L9 [Rickettsiales bacterium]